MASRDSLWLFSTGDEPMTWETPAFVELKMDAEINSYQDDFAPDRDDSV